MFGSNIIEIAIGLAFVYLLLSLICSTLTEIVARALAMRSKNLYEGIENLLKDSKYKDLFFKHPLIERLSRQGLFDWVFRRKSFPSYISSDIFARALLDIIMDKNNSPDGQKKIKEIIRDLKDNEELKKLLRSVTREAKDEYADVKKSIETWFDESMDRVSGWYTRKAQLITMILALVTTVALNADSLMIADSLSKDPILRQSIVKAAEKYIAEFTPPPTPVPDENSPEPGGDSDTDETRDTGADVEAEGGEIVNEPGSGEDVEEIEQSEASKTENKENDPAEGVKQPLAEVDKIKEQLTSLNLPIGWSAEQPRGMGLLEKILGLFLTAVAVSLGAPFWFDTLNKLVNIRSAGKKPKHEAERAGDKKNK